MSEQVRVTETRVPFSQLTLDAEIHEHEIDRRRLAEFCETLRKPQSWIQGYIVECVQTGSKLAVIDGRLVALAYRKLGREIPVRIYENLPRSAWLVWRYRNEKNKHTRTPLVLRQLQGLMQWFQGWRRTIMVKFFPPPVFPPKPVPTLSQHVQR
jgi:hypothetical protein